MALPTLLVKGNLLETGYGPKQKELDEIVPIDYITDWFSKKISHEPNIPNPPGKSPADKILIVRSSTGSGKSTVMMSELFHKYYAKTKKNIACTQPRVFNAIDIPVKQVIPFNTKQFLVDSGKKDREPLVLEENIGYQTKAFTKKPTKGLIYMTIGVLTQQLKIMTDKEFMQRYSFIVIDEAHERSIDTDFVLMAMKKFITKHYKNPDCPFLIITSATFDPYKFADYMLSNESKKDRYSNIIDVLGFSHKITDTYLKYSTNDFVTSAINLASQIHKDHPEDLDNEFRDILIFVSGVGDIKKIITGLSAIKFENPIIPISVTRSDIQGETTNFQNITKPYKEIKLIGGGSGNDEVDGGSKNNQSKHPTRRIMVATNVGETGITYPNLKYVIDTGFYNSSEFDPTLGVELLINKPVTKGMYRQRRGRCGRNAPGHAYALYTENSYNMLQEDAYPEIIKSEITTNILSLLIMEADLEAIHNNINLNELFTKTYNNTEYENNPSKITNYFDNLNKTNININKIDLLDKPSPDSWQYSLEKLFMLGAINTNSVPTALGIVIDKFPSIKIESISMILSSYAWGVSTSDLITIAVFLEQRRSDIFTGRDEKEYISALHKGEFAIFGKELTNILVSDDFINYLLIYYQFKQAAMNNDDLDLYTKSSGINLDTMININALRDEVMISMAKIGLDPYYNYRNGIDALLRSKQNIEYNDILKYLKGLKQCIFEGYKLNVAIYNKKENRYITKKSHISLDINKEYLGIYSVTNQKSNENPNIIIFDKIRYMRSPMANIYEPIIDNVSIIDGYVPYDDK